MKILIVFLFCIQNLFSQEITIPFRDGNLWGVCNETGKILIAPKFDKLEFTKSHEKTHEYIISTLNEFEGLIINGKEILEPKQTLIYEDEGLFNIRSNENGSSADIILPNGTSIFEKSIAKIIYSGKFGGSQVVYHVLNPDLTESLFVYDMKNLKTIQYLYKNYHSIVKLDKQSDVENYTILVKKTPKSDFVTETWNMSKLPYLKTNSGVRYIKEEEFLNYFLDKYYQNKWENNSGKYQNYGEVKAVAYDVEEVEEVPNNERLIKKTVDEVPVTVDLQHYFKIIDNKLFLESYTYRNYKSNKIEELILDVPTKDIAIKSANFILNRTNGKDYYNNYIRFPKNQKTVIIFPNDLKKQHEFDFVDERSFRVMENNIHKELVFLVGKKDKNNILKYGLFSNVRSQIIDFEYDELKDIHLYNNNGNVFFMAKQNEKYGIIQSDGTILLACNSSELKKLINKYRSDEHLYQIQNNTKYGFVHLSNKGIEVVEPIFDYPIQGVISKFPLIENRKITGNNLPQSTMMLIELQDENNNFIGYANRNGMQYFKN